MLPLVTLPIHNTQKLNAYNFKYLLEAYSPIYFGGEEFINTALYEGFPCYFIGILLEEICCEFWAKYKYLVSGELSYT